jgi:hypothetical protein
MNNIIVVLEAAQLLMQMIVGLFEMFVYSWHWRAINSWHYILLPVISDYLPAR